MSIYKKINQAIEKIKNSDLKKTGKNTFSGYSYYTPEQVDKLVYDACKELNLFVKFDLLRNELGEFGELKVICLDDESQVVYTMASAIPEIKATNVTQQIGGCMTYTKRYMLMNVFDIVDNNLDFDAGNNSNNTAPDKKWLNRTDKEGNVLKSYNDIIKKAKEKKLKVNDLEKHYRISKNVKTYLESDLA